MATHRADASVLLDERGYRGALIRGQNPAHLFEKAVRDRIVESYYWKEQCFGLNAATLCDRAVQLTSVGGMYGMQKPTPFLCLAFKLLQLVPPREIILEYLNWHQDEGEDEEEDWDENEKKNGERDTKRAEQDEDDEDEEEGRIEEDNNSNSHNHNNSNIPPRKDRRGDFKYLRALAAFYIRLAWEPVDIYKTLEPLLADYRKLKQRKRETFGLTFVDQFIDDLLTKERVCATSLWKLPARATLEDLEMLEPRESLLDDLDLDQ